MKSMNRALAVFTALVGVLLIVVALRARSESSEPIEQTHALDEEAVARRAYEISTGPDAGSPEENWHRAEDELRGERALPPADASA